MKYKPIYEVKISGQQVGYVKSKKAFEKSIKTNLLEIQNKNVDSVNITNNPEYELKLIAKSEETNEEQVLNKIESELDVTYKYYEIALNNVVVDSVDTIEDAEQLVNEVKSENEGKEIALSIIEKYTQKQEDIKTSTVEVAKQTVTSTVTQKLIEEQKQKQEQERINAMPVINGIRLSYTPVSGTITSRYGVSSRIRKSTHTGLDIAATTGTPIKVIADGTVTGASYIGSYGNLVKVDHGNGLETWYAHTSKMYVKVGQKVSAGEVIAAVGSTGNSTGAHLHLEIRINGVHVNPQQYLYK